MKRRKIAFQFSAFIVSVAITVFIFVSSGSVHAQTASTLTNSNVIQACVDRENGKPRIVNPNTLCRRDEQLLSWNKMGLQGAKGDPGLQGAKVDPGSPGLPGLQGSTTPDIRFGQNTNQAAIGQGQACTLGEIILSAGSVANGVPANGQLISISQSQALFSLLGTTYGGDGKTNFALPNLKNAAPNGLTYSICTQGIYPSRL